MAAVMLSESQRAAYERAAVALQTHERNLPVIASSAFHIAYRRTDMLMCDDGIVDQEAARLLRECLLKDEELK